MKVGNLIILKLIFISAFLSGCRNTQDVSFNDPDVSFQSSDSSLSSIKTSESFELYGQTSGYGLLKTDGIADFGLALKSFSRQDLYQIELNDLMSTKFDKISIMGSSIEIPANVALPQQKERYILSINLNKPHYSLTFALNESPHLVLLHGQFPFSDVVQGFRNDQPLLKLADKFNILSFSEYHFENLNKQPRVHLDLVAGQKKHTANMTLKSPSQFSSEYTYVVVALDHKNNLFLPNNLTVLKPNESKIFNITNDDTYIFSGLIHESFADAESKSLLKYKMSFQMTMAQYANSDPLDFIENIIYKNETIYFDKPQNFGFTELGMVYNIVEIAPDGEEQILVQNFTASSWNNTIDLTGFESLKKSKHSYRFDLFLGAAYNHYIPQDSFDFFENSELMTRNSILL